VFMLLQNRNQFYRPSTQAVRSRQQQCLRRHGDASAVLCCCRCAQVLLVKFNKARQAKITQEISEIVSGANATG
jgi:F0F1-type ATP synthase gamma subunit